MEEDAAGKESDGLDGKGGSPSLLQALKSPQALHEYFMRQALTEASKAAEEGEVPVGAVIVSGTKIIGRAHNQREALSDPTAHAEMLAITQAAEYIGNWRLGNVFLYVTCEPCPMCAGAIVLARIGHLVYGCADSKAGACGTLYDIVRDPRLNHRVNVTSGVLAEECSALLTEFFKARRDPV